MQNKGAWASRAWFGALALIGMVAGHQTSFFVAERDGVHRHALLEATGHGSWASVNAIAAAIGLAVLVGFVGASIRSAHSGRQPRAGYLGGLLRLAPLQVAAFIGVEVVERASSGASLAEILTDRVILIGLFVQVLVALVSCLILLLVSHAVVRLVRSVAIPEARVAIPPIAVDNDLLPLDLSRVAWSLRGPPLTSI